MTKACEQCPHDQDIMYGKKVGYVHTRGLRMNMFVSFQKGLHTNTKQTLEVLSLKRSLQNHPIKTIVYGLGL